MAKLFIKKTKGWSNVVLDSVNMALGDENNMYDKQLSLNFMMKIFNLIYLHKSRTQTLRLKEIIL